MHRIRVALVLLAAALLITTCATMRPMAPAAEPALTGPCRDNANGVQNADAPIVCVDDSANDLSVDPDPFIVHETPSGGGGGSPVVQWITRSGNGELKIDFRDEGCVRNIVCNGGRCTAVAAKLKAGEEKRQCKYNVMLTGHPTLDPEGVIVRCCVSP